MKRALFLLGGTLLLPCATLAPAATPGEPLASECAGVSRLSVEGVAIASVTPVPSGSALSTAAPGARRAAPTASRSFCRVQGTIDKTIRFELWLPSKDQWNGKYLAGGVGGAAGTFNMTDLPRGVSRGYAAATTDTGHSAADPKWMLDPVARDNFTHRANHLLAARSKALIEQFYGKAPTHSYFIGCSGGGRQALKESQLFPEDYDGIISGANGPQTPEMTDRRMWEILQRDSQPHLMKPTDWQLIAESGRKACDAADGVQDGSVEDPRRCTFTVGSLQCKPGQTVNCLTGEQVKFAETFYAPLRDSAGRAIDEGILPGVLIDSGRSQLAPATFGQGVRGVAEWNGEGFDVGRDLAAVKKAMPQLQADQADLSRFRKRGGKLIMYSGWFDPAVAARMVVAYHEAVVRRAGGPAAAARFERLYMIPGMYHCAGGPGADQIGGSGADAPIVDAGHDLLTALEEWVERGHSPGPVIASKVEQGKVTRTHLICPYPQRARYVGGDPNRAESFSCEAPARGRA